MAKFKWEKSYPAGIDWHFELRNRPAYAVLDEAVEAYGGNVMLDFLGKSLTYSEVSALVDRAAAGFQKLGVGPGVRVGLFLPNTPHYIISFFGILKAGGIVVNYSPLDAVQTLKHKAEDSGTDIIVTLNLKALYEPISQILEQTQVSRLIIGTLQEMLPFPKSFLFPLVKRGEISKVPVDDQHISFSQLLDNDGKFKAREIKDPVDEVAVLQYTGGTTGLAKGAMLTHNNLVAAYSQYVEFANGDTPSLNRGVDVFLAVLPLFHIFALQINMFMAIGVGARIILHPRFEIDDVLKDIDKKKPTVFAGVPAMYVAINNYPNVGKYDLSSLRYCVSGGAPLALDTLQAFEKISGTKLCEGWGMTETCPSGTGIPLHGEYKEGSCGLPLPRIEIRVYDFETSTKKLPTGKKGEICISGPNVMKGYWGKPKETAEAFNADGFFRTGDSGYIDADGYVFLIDRIKDLILVSGFNVYPRAVEEAIYKHPDVEETIVIGIADKKRGQSPKAFIKLKAGADEFTLDQFKAFLKDKLGRHEMIRALEFRDELPKTAVGKLSKKELYEEEEAKAKSASA